MSSDSEDDCYGNTAQKLQSMKSKYREDKIETSNLLLKDLKEKTDNSWRKNDSITSEKDLSLSEIGEEYSLDAIIAKNSKKRPTRKRNAVSVDNILPETASSSKKTKKIEATTSQCHTTAQNDPPTQNVPSRSNILNDTTVTETTRGRGRGRGRKSRGRRQPYSSRNKSNQSRGCVRNSCSDPWIGVMNDPSLYDLVAAMAASTAMMSGPVYSVGNTDEYPDQSDDQPLFNSRVTQDVAVIENEPELENEELSVKVYWQSSEHVKFNIRRFQKLTQIFDHFAKQENVDHDKLLFTYNDKILKSDDTPDSINYSIVKFIDGGIVNQSVSRIVNNGSKDDGIKLKFQCQNVKKPFLLSINPDDKMSVVMMKCAEHLEKPLETLKFYFDGDLLSSKQTAKELEMEGGECIDVKTITPEKDLSQNSEKVDDLTEKNSKKKATSAISSDNILPETTTANRTGDSVASTSQFNTTSQNDPPTPQSMPCQSDINETSVTETTRGSGRGRGRKSRGRGKPNSRNKSKRSRCRVRKSCSDPWIGDMNDPSLYDLEAAMAASTAMMSASTAMMSASTAMMSASTAMMSGPVYSVGNTDEYPDQSDDQPLFNSRVTQDVAVIENEPELENEELSVKVYWQSSEHVKFNIRRFQKLTQIFDHFAKQENVDQDKLLFTYNDKILKSDDTPDSINYSIVKFIDGGIVNQSVSRIVNNGSKDDGIKLKFQCQNVKKPFLLSINPDDKMSVVMMKCAEHLEKPLETLKFYFDGDLLSGKHTAKELEMDGGECIDVKSIS